jgi:acyl-CoA thioester hydrolase
MIEYRIEKPWVITTARIPYGHVDQMGHIYYGNYLLYFEMARTEMMRAGGLTYREFEEMGYMVPVLEAHANYHGRVLYDDEIDIYCKGSIVGRTKMKFEYEIKRVGEDKVLTSGWTMHAVINEKGRPVRVPVEILDMINKSNGE